MTEAEKDVIRERHKTMTLEELGAIHGFQRERIRQIVSEPPNEARRAIEISFGLGTYKDDFDGTLPPLTKAQRGHRAGKQASRTRNLLRV